MYAVNVTSPFRLPLVSGCRNSGVGPVDNRPSTNMLPHKKNVTCDTWHVIHDMWRVTYDMLGGWTFSQNVSSLALNVCDLWYFEDFEEKGYWLTEIMNYWINDEAVYNRKALATPGLFNIALFVGAYYNGPKFKCQPTRGVGWFSYEIHTKNLKHPWLISKKNLRPFRNYIFKIQWEIHLLPYSNTDRNAPKII